MFCQAIILVQLGFLMVQAFDGSTLKCSTILLATLKNAGRNIFKNSCSYQPRTGCAFLAV